MGQTPFASQPSKPDFWQLQQDITAHWKEQQIFERSISSRDAANPYRFYDGPPFITGLPHYGSLLSSVCKDVIPRYQTMKGKRVERVWGWDCHGIPIEDKVQKKLGLESNTDVANVGIETFIRECYRYTNDTSDQRNRYIDAVGRRVDIDNAYRTMDTDYMESTMRVFAQLRNKGYVYEGKRVSQYSRKLNTPISNFEIAMDDSYETVDDPAITVMFDVSANGDERADTYILAWTTTPWTIPANMALAVNTSITYAKVSCDGLLFIVAANRVETVFAGKTYEIVGDVAADDMVGLSYEPPFAFYTSTSTNSADHKVYHADFITDTDGTGIGHEAPEFGDVDFQLAQHHGITISEAMDDSGYYTEQLGEYEGMHFRDANDVMIDQLRERGRLFKKESITHRVAFCPRTATPLVFKAQKSRFIDIQSIKKQLLDQNQSINRYPHHFRDGRFANSIESAPDWCISRTRFWGTPMPIWETPRTVASTHEGDAVYTIQAADLASADQDALTGRGRVDIADVDDGSTGNTGNDGDRSESETLTVHVAAEREDDFVGWLKHALYSGGVHGMATSLGTTNRVVFASGHVYTLRTPRDVEDARRHARERSIPADQHDFVFRGELQFDEPAQHERRIIGSRDDIYTHQHRPTDLTQWIICRHGETEQNKARANGGTYDFGAYTAGHGELSAQGIEDAHAYATELAPIIKDAGDAFLFVLSPAKRILQTFDPLCHALFGMSLTQHPVAMQAWDAYQELVEAGDLSLETLRQHRYQVNEHIVIDFRAMEMCDIDRTDPDFSYAWGAERVGRGESVLMAYHRMVDLVDSYNTSHAGQTLVMGSHGTPLVMFKKYHTDLRREDRFEGGHFPRPGSWQRYYYDGETPYCPVTKVVVVRHGQYDTSDPDGLLTDEGERQADHIAAQLADQDIGVIISSSVRRCPQTVAPLARQEGMDVIIDEAFGSMERKKIYFDRLADIGLTTQDDATPAQLDAIYEPFITADRKRLLSYVHKYPGQTIVLCAHGEVTPSLQMGLIRHPKALSYYCHNRPARGEMTTFYVHDDYDLDLHRPYIDRVTLADEHGQPLHRIDEVLDVWLDSSSMPYAQVHYPFQNKQQFEDSFPADFIVEYTGQIRAWFYVMHVIGVALFGTPSYTNVLCTGVMNGDDGRKMSKSYGNYPDPKISFERYGGDAIRMAMLTSPIVYGGDMAISEELFREMTKTIILPLRNAFSFFVTYANIDGFRPSGSYVPGQSDRFLDRRIVGELGQMTQEVDDALSRYEIHTASRSLVSFLDNLTNRYIRRSRRLFWKAETDDEKTTSYETLYYVLCTMAQAAAPFMPFVSEYIYRTLTHDLSVHLTDWPESVMPEGHEALAEQMRVVQGIVSAGLAWRSREKIRVRQPLSTLTVSVALDERYRAIIADELNIKQIVTDTSLRERVTQILLPNARKLGPKYGKHVQEIIRAAKAGQFVTNDDGSYTIADSRVEADEVEVSYTSDEDISDVSVIGDVVIMIDRVITDELRDEGYARDLIRQIQESRKEAGYDIADRIQLSLTADGADMFAAFVDSYGAMIEAETLSTITMISDKGDVSGDVLLGEMRVSYILAK